MTDDIKQLPAPITEPSPRPVRLWPLWLALALVLALCLVLGFGLYHQWQRSQTLQDGLNTLNQRDDRADDRLTQQLTDLGARQSQQELALAQLRQQQGEQTRQLNHVAASVLENGQRGRTDWLLAEAEYLLRIANQRLQSEQDFTGTLGILESADKVLSETDDPGVYPVREQIAREILALRNIQPVDRTGLFLRLEALIEQASELADGQLAVDIPEGTDLLESNTPSSEPAADTSPWQRLRATLKNVVVIRRLDEPFRPMLSPEQSAYARLNLQLTLEQAELALLRGNAALYQRTLQKARTLLNTWYDARQRQVMTLRDQIDELANQDIQPVLPDISRSLLLLKARIQGRNEAPIQVEQGGQP
ncbi:MAG: uroporphyrinogen-III C-methyltransferase [Gammaproteobacteria bacterium]|mgnify:CR=1 FL=1|nr:uroporphyrinogen-III C-methyltransferase [Gammaproteobacteria bacterium]